MSVATGHSGGLLAAAANAVAAANCSSTQLPNVLSNGQQSAATAAASAALAQQQFCLKWNNHTSNLVKTFTEMITDEFFVDVTLACDGFSIKAHKMVLSACSNYFKELFVANPCKHPIVILKDMKIEDLRAIIDFMYKGEVNVSQNQLGALLKTAESLRVKGLTEVGDPEADKSSLHLSEETEETTSLNGLPPVDAFTSTATPGHQSNANMDVSSPVPPEVPERGISLAATSSALHGVAMEMPTSSAMQEAAVSQQLTQAGNRKRRRKRPAVKREAPQPPPQQEPAPNNVTPAAVPLTSAQALAAAAHNFASQQELNGQESPIESALPSDDETTVDIQAATSAAAVAASASKRAKEMHHNNGIHMNHPTPNHGHISTSQPTASSPLASFEDQVGQTTPINNSSGSSNNHNHHQQQHHNHHNNNSHPNQNVQTRTTRRGLAQSQPLPLMQQHLQLQQQALPQPPQPSSHHPHHQKDLNAANNDSMLGDALSSDVSFEDLFFLYSLLTIFFTHILFRAPTIGPCSKWACTITTNTTAAWRMTKTTRWMTSTQTK